MLVNSNTLLAVKAVPSTSTNPSYCIREDAPKYLALSTALGLKTLWKPSLKVVGFPVPVYPSPYRLI